MIDQKQAREILKEKLADNLVIVNAFEDSECWCFGLGLVREDGDIMPLMGNSTIKISKETGEME